MENEEKKEIIIGFALPDTSIADLRGKQSVRTTFKLSTKTINAVSIVATHLGIKQKSLFDHLIENIHSLQSISDIIQDAELKKRQGIPKTYVISRKSLDYLDHMSKVFNMPRDLLVEYSVQRLMPIIEREREKHEKRKQIAENMKDYLKMGRTILGNSRKELGEDDPVYLRMRSAIIAVENAYKEIASFVEKGKIIEDFE